MNQGKGLSPVYQKFANKDQGYGKSVSPGLGSQPRLSHNTAYTNSTKDLLKNNQIAKGLKSPTNGGSFIPGGGNHLTPTSPKNDMNGTKTIPSFLENKNSLLKNSLFVENSQYQHRDSKQPPGKNNGGYMYSKNSMGQKPAKRTPRMSQHTEMKSSSTDFDQDNKVPSFLQERNKQQYKKIPYPNQLERPESSKEFGTNKSAIMQQNSLTSSYGIMKKSKIDPHSIQVATNSSSSQDPTQDWVKKSWNKKKQKKYDINDFQQISQLGCGKYGHVYLAKQKKSNFICALKIIQKKLLYEQDITEQFIRQLKIQMFLNHPNVIRLYGFFDDAVNIYLILQLATCGQLFKQLKKLQSMPEPKVAGIIRQVCQAVGQLHSYQIIHRDIKPENIVLHENVIKLCDFGWSVYRDKNLRTTFCGTPLYVGPEILRGKQYDQKIDIWSLGVMMYEMLVGQNPFKITKQQELIKIVKDDIVIPNYVQVSQEATSFLFSCLQKNPDKRLTIRQLLNHAFFKKYPEKTDKKMGI